jgi:osmotically-inducible protein OsmY
MQTRLKIAIVALPCLGLVLAPQLSSRGDEPNLGEKIGRQVDRAVSRIGDELKQGWAEVRRTVDKLTVQGRVYGRLHWDRDLYQTNIEVDAVDNDVVALKGEVPSVAVRAKAVRLARETVGVREVRDSLTVAKPVSNNK